LNKDNIKIGSNKSFGIVFFIVFFIISTYPLIDGGALKIWSLGISVVFLILGILNSKILTPLNKLWFKFGILLGKIVSPVVMAFVFFGVVTPIALIMKIFKKDLLNMKKNKNLSYWIAKSGPKSKMKNQF
jgi:hypothetical protein